MRKLTYLVLGSFVGPFLATFFLTLFILVMQFIWVYVDDFMGKGLEWYVIAELLMYAMANLVPLAMPLGILLASIMTMGSMAENYELVALKSAGMSLLRIMRPIMVVVMLLSLATLAFTNYVSPVANLKFKSLLWDITEQKPALELKDNIFYTDLEGYSIRVHKRDKDTQELHDVLIYEHDEKERGNFKVIRAEKGKMSTSPDQSRMLLTLWNGHSYQEEVRNTRVYSSLPLVKNQFEKQILSFDLTGFGLKRTDDNLFKNNHQMLNIPQLIKAADSLNQDLQRRDTDYRNYCYRTLSLRDSIISEPEQTGKPVVLNKSQMKNAIYLAENQIRNVKSYTGRKKDEQENFGRKRNKYVVEKHKKLVFTAACIILFFVGAPLGAIIRKGGLGMPVVFSVIFFLVFHVLFMIGEKISVQGVVPAIVGMWINAMVLFPISLFLTVKANSDSQLFEATWYRNMLLRLKKIIPKR